VPCDDLPLLAAVAPFFNGRYISQGGFSGVFLGCLPGDFQVNGNGFQRIFWLAVHGKPVLFWKGISGLVSLLSILCMLIARMEMGTSPVSGDSYIIT